MSKTNKAGLGIWQKQKRWYADRVKTAGGGSRQDIGEKGRKKTPKKETKIRRRRGKIKESKKQQPVKTLCDR